MLQLLQHYLQPEGEVQLQVIPGLRNQASEPGALGIVRDILLEQDPAPQAELIDLQVVDQVHPAGPPRSDQVQAVGVQEQAEVILQAQGPVVQGALVHQVEAVALEVALAAEEVAINMATQR